jgi:hypothetical protein
MSYVAPSSSFPESRPAVDLFRWVAVSYSIVLREGSCCRRSVEGYWIQKKYTALDTRIN